MRVWERGAGETLSSGSGSSAAAVAAVVAGRAESPGHRAHRRRRRSSSAVDEHLHVRLTGPVQRVHRGEFSAALRRRPGGALDCASPSASRRCRPTCSPSSSARSTSAGRPGIDVISLGIGDPDLPTPAAGRRRGAAPGGAARHAPVPVEPRPAPSSARPWPRSTSAASASSSTPTPRCCRCWAARRASRTCASRCSTPATSAWPPIRATPCTRRGRCSPVPSRC